MNFYLLIPFFIILIMFIPIKFQFNTSFNFLDFSGSFGIFLYGKNISSQLFWVDYKKIMLKKEQEIKIKEFEFKGKEIQFVKILFKEIKNKIKLKEFDVFYNIGCNDAFFSAMCCGYLNIVLMFFLLKIKNDKTTASISLNNNVSYNRKLFQISNYTNFSLSLFDVVYSILVTVILTIRKQHEKRYFYKY